MKALGYGEFAIKMTKLFEFTMSKFESYMNAKKEGYQLQMTDGHSIAGLMSILDTLSKRKTLHILYFLIRYDRLRFNEFQRTMGSEKIDKLDYLGIGKISSRTLSIRLKELEKLGIVERKKYAEIPPRVEYSLTEKGRELKLPMAILYWWSIRRGEQFLLFKKSIQGKHQNISIKKPKSTISLM